MANAPASTVAVDFKHLSPAQVRRMKVSIAALYNDLLGGPMSVMLKVNDKVIRSKSDAKGICTGKMTGNDRKLMDALNAAMAELETASQLVGAGVA